MNKLCRQNAEFLKLTTYTALKLLKGEMCSYFRVSTIILWNIFVLFIRYH